MANEEVMEKAAPQEEEAVLNIRKPNCIFDKITNNFYGVICFVMTILLTIIISAATLMRYVFEMDLYGYEEWIKMFAFWLYFMGAGYGAYAGTHVSADLVQSYVKEGPVKRLLAFIKCLVTFCVCLLFTKYGWDYFIFGFLGPLGTGIGIPKTTAWRIPLWTSYAPILIGLVSMSYYFLWDLIRAAKALFGGNK